jgi:fucose permease
VEILALLAASSLVWALFAWRMLRAKEPFIPLSVLRDRVISIGTSAAFFGVGSMIALTFFLPLYMQLGLGLDVVGAGLAIMALQGGATVTSIVGGRLIGRLIRYKRVPIVGLSLSVLALLPLVAAPVGFPVWLVLALILLAGLGLGPMFPFTIVLVQNVVPMHQLGIATGSVNFFRNLGGTFIVAVFGAIVLAGAPAMTLPLRASAVDAALLVADPTFTFRLVFAAAALCIAISLACVIALEERPMRGAAG